MTVLCILAAATTQWLTDFISKTGEFFRTHAKEILIIAIALLVLSVLLGLVSAVVGLFRKK